MISWLEFIQLSNVGRLPEYTASIEMMRDYRNIRLQASDLAVIRYTEAGLPVPAEWVTYRQALRDITTTFPDPESVVFPDPPEVVIPPSVVSQEDRLEAAELMIDLLLDTQESA
jgi:hypothetical protein